MNYIYRYLIISCFLIGLTLSLDGQLTPSQAIIEMGRGINIGNTLEPPNEGSWNNGPVQEYYFDDYKDAGFTNIRIPVTWHGHTGSSSPYTVNAAWMDRIEEIVDWGLSRGLYIILNAHHDAWIKNDYSTGNKARFDSIWSQISVRFQNKSDSLLFEIINEPEPLSLVNVDDLNARVLSIIRKTNPTRIVLFSGHRWSNAEELVVADIPVDNYIMGYFHSYDPYPFGLEGTGSFRPSHISAIIRRHDQVQNWSDNNNIPVLLGEFGAINLCDYNSRMLHYATVTEQALSHGFAFSAWDDGGDFRIYQRDASEWNELKDILIHTYETSPTLLKFEFAGDNKTILSWTNRTAENDSIDIEWKIEDDFIKLARLAPEADSFIIEDLEFDSSYYFRLKTSLHNTLMYSYPLKVRIYPINSIELSEADFDFSIYPNPANDEINIRFVGNNNNAMIELFDYTGKIIRSIELLSYEQTINLAGLNRGMYFIRLVSSDHTLTKRFLKL